MGPRQLGQWEMLIDPVYVTGGTMRASTNVAVESELQMTAQVQASSVGAPLSVQVGLTHNGSALAGADVHIELNAPLNSLSQLSTPIVRHRALVADTFRIPASLQILTQTRTTQYQAQFNKRFYVSELPRPTIDGVYHAQVIATGNACGGIFERYWSSSFYVGPTRTKDA